MVLLRIFEGVNVLLYLIHLNLLFVLFFPLGALALLVSIKSHDSWVIAIVILRFLNTLLWAIMRWNSDLEFSEAFLLILEDNLGIRF